MIRLMILFVVISLLPTLSRAQEKFVSVCDRNHRIQLELSTLIGLHCSDIKPHHLAGVLQLTVFTFERYKLTPDDFANFDNLGELTLQGVEETPTRITRDTFRPLANLKALTLRGNIILEPHALDDLRNLEELSFIGLSALSDATLANLSSLKNFTLEDMWGGPEIWKQLNGLRNLEELNLRQAHMTNLDPAVLSQMKNLKKLNVDNNDFRQGLAPETFDGLANLEELSMRKTLLSGLNPRWASAMPRLRTLLLSINPLDEADAEFFAPLTNLETLELNNVGIRSISAEAFVTLTNLQELSLRNSRNLQHIDDFAFAHMKKLKLVQVEDSPLKETRKAAFFGVNVVGLPDDFDQDAPADQWSGQ